MTMSIHILFLRIIAIQAGRVVLMGNLRIYALEKQMLNGIWLAFTRGLFRETKRRAEKMRKWFQLVMNWK